MIFEGCDFVSEFVLTVVLNVLAVNVMVTGNDANVT